jgi:membrane protein implicated in regulation of membrane protease activity
MDFHDAHGGGDHGSTWMFGVISFRTVVAALTFFGLAGMFCLSNHVAPLPTVVVASAVGFAAMWAVYRVMRLLYSLGQDRTLRIERSVGARGTVYIPIPPKKQGIGKVQLRLQERIVECAAMTAGPDKLPTGATVVVTDVISPTTLEVELAPEYDEATLK